MSYIIEVDLFIEQLSIFLSWLKQNKQTLDHIVHKLIMNYVCRFIKCAVDEFLTKKKVKHNIKKHKK